MLTVLIIHSNIRIRRFILFVYFCVCLFLTGYLQKSSLIFSGGHLPFALLVVLSQSTLGKGSWEWERFEIFCCKVQLDDVVAKLMIFAE